MLHKLTGALSLQVVIRILHSDPNTGVFFSRGGGGGAGDHLPLFKLFIKAITDIYTPPLHIYTPTFTHQPRIPYLLSNQCAHT